MAFDITSVFGLGEKLLDGILRFIPDRGKAQELAVEVQRIYGDVVQAEMKSAWLVGQWRAIAMLMLTAAIVFRYAVGSLSFVGNEADMTMGLIWILGLGGYSLSPEAIKQALTIMKRKDGEPKP